MPRNGTGTYVPPASSWNPGINGVTATTADWNALLVDMTAALSQSISSDGQTPMTGNLPMGNNKITGLAAGTANTDAINFTQQVGRLIGVQTFLAGGVYTPTAGTTSIIVEVQGGGGGGGGTQACAAGQVAAAPGGNAGAYVKSRHTSGFSGATVTVGVAGGGGGVGGAGANGGTSSFVQGGINLQAPGGTAGAVGTAAAPPIVYGPSATGTLGSGGTILNMSGRQAKPGFSMSTGSALSGAGADSMFGSGAGAIGLPGAGSGTIQWGAGGGGALTGSGGAGNAGGTGGQGAVIVWEYS